ncbi:hypothetical protein T492DRAFT_1054258, partial [Pavlovales sp. CCMP2436]
RGASARAAAEGEAEAAEHVGVLIELAVRAHLDVDEGDSQLTGDGLRAGLLYQEAARERALGTGGAEDGQETGAAVGGIGGGCSGKGEGGSGSAGGGEGEADGEGEAGGVSVAGPRAGAGQRQRAGARRGGCVLPQSSLSPPTGAAGAAADSSAPVSAVPVSAPVSAAAEEEEALGESVSREIEASILDAIVDGLPGCQPEPSLRSRAGAAARPSRGVAPRDGRAGETVDVVQRAIDATLAQEIGGDAGEESDS